jgi:hypothetical protein
VKDRKITPCLLTAALLGGCSAWNVPDDAPRELLPAVALDTRVAFVDRTHPRAFLIDPAAPESPRLVPLPRDPVAATRRLGADELLVLSRGERGEPGLAPQPPALTVVPGDPARPLVSVPLASRFSGMAQSADGRFVVTAFLGSASGPAGETLFNPNELAVVDLAAARPTAVARTLRSYGTVPSAITFSPPLKLADGPRTLAVIFADNFVTLLDVEHPTRSEVTIGLTLPPDDRRTLRPAQVVFDPDDPALYLRADGANDVYALRLVPVPAAERGADGNDFRPALSLLAAGTGPADMALYDAPEGRRLLVVSPGSSDAAVIDAHSSRSTRIPLDAPASRILLFSGLAPGDPKSRPRALLVGPGLAASAVSFLDLEQLEGLRARNLDSRPMGAAAAAAYFFPERGQALILHSPRSGGPGLSVIDLARRTVAPLFAQSPPTDVTATQGTRPEGDKIWIGSDRSDRLGFVTLGSLSPGEVRLDAPVTSVLPVPHPTDGHPRVVAVHPSAVGSLTVLDADQPERATARAAYGFLLTNLLDRPQEDR